MVTALVTYFGLCTLIGWFVASRLDDWWHARREGAGAELLAGVIGGAIAVVMRLLSL